MPVYTTKPVFQLSESENQAMWSDALIVLDANVLLNLYRLPQETANKLLKAFDRLSQRLWIPNYAAIEYQRNRLSVIEEMNGKGRPVEQTIGQIRTKLQMEIEKTLSNPTPPKIDFENLGSKGIHGENTTSIDDRIRLFITNNAGDPPKDQQYLNELWDEGEKRYKSRIPPGYMDQQKKFDSKPNEFQFCGLMYKRIYGDLLIWNQIIDHAKKSKLAQIIFVTDDQKEDWFSTIGTNRKFKVGPRRELTYEIANKAGVKFLLIYNSNQFLKKYSQFCPQGIDGA